MEVTYDFLVAINPYGLLNWCTAIYCTRIYYLCGGRLVLFMALLNIMFGVLGILMLMVH